METLKSIFNNDRFWCHLSTIVMAYYFEYPSSFESPRNWLILLLCYLVTEFIYDTLG